MKDDDEWVTVDGVRYEPRHKVIEEYARVADDMAENTTGVSSLSAQRIATRIRALKDKP